MAEPDRLTYTPAAKFWHWLTFTLVAVQIAVGWIMDEAHRNTPPTTLNDVHITIGITLLAVIILRFAYRLAAGVPNFEPGTPVWQGTLATSVHLLLYIAIVVMVLSGWANATYHGWAIHIYSVVPLPQFFPGSSFVRPFGRIHGWFIWVVLAGIAVHTAAALWHHYVMRDRTMLRMLPGNMTGIDGSAR